MYITLQHWVWVESADSDHSAIKGPSDWFIVHQRDGQWKEAVSVSGGFGFHCSLGPIRVGELEYVQGIRTFFMFCFILRTTYTFSWLNDCHSIHLTLQVLYYFIIILPCLKCHLICLSNTSAICSQEYCILENLKLCIQLSNTHFVTFWEGVHWV